MVLILITAVTACGAKDTPAAADPNEGAAPVDAPEGEDTGEDETPAPSVPVTITHEYGETTVNTDPEKIIVMDFGILDMFDTVGIEVGGLPQDTIPDYLSAYVSDDYVNVGTLKDLDLEAINEYGPDLIIISGRQASFYEELNQIAPTLYLKIPAGEYFNEMAGNVEVLKQVFPSKADAFQTTFDDILTKANALKADAAAENLTSLVLMANDGSFNVFGNGSRYGIVSNDFGFISADDNINASLHGMSASYEYIAEKNPDVLFVIDRSVAIGTTGASGATTLLDNDLVNGTTAAATDRIIYLSSDVWYLSSGGFTGTLRMIEEVTAALK